MNDPKNIKPMTPEAIDQYRKKEPPPKINPSLIERAKRMQEQKAPPTTPPAPPTPPVTPPSIRSRMDEMGRAAAEAAAKNFPGSGKKGMGQLSLGSSAMDATKRMLENRKQRKMMQK